MHDFGVQAKAPTSLLLITRSAALKMLREYGREWARAFLTGPVGASCDHARMLAAVKCPVLFTHHFRWVDEETGTLVGAISDQQATRARELITGTGQPFGYHRSPKWPT